MGSSKVSTPEILTDLFNFLAIETSQDSKVEHVQ